MRPLIVFACALVLAVSAGASVGFVHEESYTISPFTPTLSTTQIVRLDESGTIGFLWHSDSEVRLYDPALDSVILSRTWDSSEVVLQTVIGNVMGDSTYDLVLVVATNPEYWSPITWRLLCLDGGSGYVDSADETFTSNVMSLYYYVGQMSLLGLIDIDDDNSQELVFSYNDVDESIWEEHVSGYTLAYDRFPDSLLWSRSYLTTSLQSAVDINGRQECVSRTYSLDYFDFGPDLLLIDNPLHVLRSDGTLGSFTPPCDDSACEAGFGDNECELYYVTASDATPLVTGDDLLAMRLNSFYCPIDESSSYKVDLVMLRFDASLPVVHVEEVWSIPAPSHLPGLGNFMIHPNLPGYFFGIAGDTLFMFRGENGTIRSQTTDIPHGQRYWETRWPDSIPRLVVMNGNQVDIYSLDIATAIEDEPPSSLPQQFILGQPYPNPFNAETSVPIDLPERGHLRLEIFNLLGQAVATLANGEFSAGKLDLAWDATGHPSGIYLVRADFGAKTETRKLILLK